MRDLSRRDTEIAAEIGWIAAAPGRVDDRANAFLDTLHRLVPFQAAGIRLLDRDRQPPAPLVRRGYDDLVCAYIDSKESVQEMEMLGFTRDRQARRVQDLPVRPERIRGWTDYMQPAGFRGGLAVGLFAADGRHVGILGLNTDTDRHPDEAARDLIGLLAPAIANAVDPMRTISEAARMVEDAEAGVVLDATGAVSALPGMLTHPLLLVGSPVLRAALRQLGEGAVRATFLSPYQLLDADVPHHVRITVLHCPPQPMLPGAVLVLVSPAGDLNGLTRRELDVLGLVVEGWPNQRIAAALVVAERTVAAHVEHILAKLDVATRTLAAVRALRMGLYVPPELSIPRRA